MKVYKDLSNAELKDELLKLKSTYDKYKTKGFKLNLSRGKPDSEQISLSRGMLDILSSETDMTSIEGVDSLNYGEVSGILEAKEFMADILEVNLDEIFVGGNSSLNLIHDCIGMAYVKGFPNSDKPWCKYDKIKFLCPTPGYDRHFAISEHYGFELISIPFLEDGPDMDMIEKLVSEDDSIKGMWNVPKYSNPTGITYSDETVKRLASLKPKAKDFTIIWDNAYVVHHLEPENPDVLLPLLDELKRNNNENMALLFASTSKVTFPGGGISAVAGSKEMIDFVTKNFAMQTIGFDKINQLRHVSFFKKTSIETHMARHAKLLRPKFDLVLNVLDKSLGQTGIAKWNKPMGGYFISLDIPKGCAKRTYDLCKDVGLVLTPAGATFPYGIDPNDENIRLAPTFAKTSEIEDAVNILCVSCKIAALEKYIRKTEKIK
ncbi:MAG: aminotransferase class I/II-fold pyridoxal phosphate-dependent enzyme [Lachnospirales bacterium]